MRIIHIAAEFAPFAKAGGLGEVVTGLCRQLALEHEKVEIILPKYSFIPSHLLQNLAKEKIEFPLEQKQLQYKELILKRRWQQKTLLTMLLPARVQYPNEQHR